MSRPDTRSARVVNVATGVEDTDRTAPARDRRHQALGALIGKWINLDDARAGRALGAVHG